MAVMTPGCLDFNLLPDTSLKGNQNNCQAPWHEAANPALYIIFASTCTVFP